MAIRCGYTVGRTTTESALSDQLKKYRTKDIKAIDEKPASFIRKVNPAHESLFEKCVKVVVANFDSRPITEPIPLKQMTAITKLLPTTLSPVVAGKYIHHEGYWKRCCVDKFGWHNCQLTEHNLSWKQLYFEKLMQDKLEDFDSVTEDIETIYELIDSCMDHIFTLKFRQFPSHANLYDICALLPNLAKLDIVYGVKKIGMNYERMLFGMKISDATSFAKIFEQTDTIATLILSGNLIDDDLLRMLMTGLIKNNTITHLDMSHNKITNHGARLLSKLLGENSVITTMDLSDNHIHSEGGRYFARGLRENDSLLQLNLRLNRLADEGCNLLLEGLRDNVSLTDLNIGSNGAGAQSAQCLMAIIRDPDHTLSSLDVSGNQLTSEHFEQLRLSIANNRTLTSLDLRNNAGYEPSAKALTEIMKVVHNNEFISRQAAGHP